MAVKTEVVLAAAKVARSSPSEWSDFLKALHSYSDDLTQNCISSPVEQLQIAQGRAQVARDIVATLVDCVKRADQVLERRKQ